jgi:hypothetical protein
MLWMCHVSNVALSLGLLLDKPAWVRLGVIWLIFGHPLWVMHMIQTGERLPTSFLSHLGGLAVGLIAFHKVRADRSTWLYAIIWYFVIQQLSRMLTRPELNVNIAHSMTDGWDQVFSSYWQYWVVVSFLMAVSIWILGFLLLKVFPPSTSGSSSA